MMALTSILDPLYCPEDQLELDDDAPLTSHLPVPVADVAPEPLEDWAELLSSLVAKQWETHPALSSDGAHELYLRSARKGAVEWVARAAARHGFSAFTAVLAVNYLDRCFLSGGGGVGLQGDRPWMGRLSAVACLSLAAKVEETYVPLLLDLQVAVAEAEVEAGYVFEAKTVRRMELLVLSALGWRMNPVTPLSFVHLLLPNLFPNAENGNLTTSSSARLRCEAILLSVIGDRRWVRYPASVWAAAAIRHALAQQLEPGNGIAAVGCRHETQHLLALLNAPKEKVEECSELILDCIGGSRGGDIGHGHKRNHLFTYLDRYASPPSPNAVLGSCFSCESSSSCDFRAMWSSLSTSSSPEVPPPKRSNCIAAKAFGNEQSGENGDRLHHQQPRVLDCNAVSI